MHPEQEPAPFPAAPRAGIREPYEALLRVPRKYVHYPLVNAAELAARLDQRIVLCLYAMSKASSSYGARPSFTLSVQDETGQRHALRIFGRLKGSPWEAVDQGATLYVACKPALFRDTIYLNNVEWVPQEWVNRVVPHYHGKRGVLGADRVREAVDWAIHSERAVTDACIVIRQRFAGMAESEILKLCGLSGTLELLLYALHRPRTLEMAEWALAGARRIAAYNLQYLAQKHSERPLRIETAIRVPEADVQALIDALPYQPTQGARSQATAIQTLFEELAAPYAMDAILTADVGVGKTLCYMIPAVALQRMGKRVCIIVPNVILAESIANEFREAFPETPVARVTDAKEGAAVAWDDNPILIGTIRVNGLAKRRGWTPHLLVVDEQQKLAAEQRSALIGADTNVIEASATPLPRTLAMLRYGGKTRIEVDKQHAVKSLPSEVIFPEDRKRAFAKMAEVVQSGYQAAIIYPKVEGKGEDIKSVQTAAARWESLYPGEVVMIHGKMSNEEKDQAMAIARSGTKRIVVASSIIEIGVTMANLRFLLVVNADRYGVSTLHQMRGRLARRGGTGYFYAYLPEAVEEDTLARVRLLEATTNGFELAELDMEQRGFGSLSGDGEKQSGKSNTLFEGVALMPSDFREETLAQP